MNKLGNVFFVGIALVGACVATVVITLVSLWNNSLCHIEDILFKQQRIKEAGALHDHRTKVENLE